MHESFIFLTLFIYTIYKGEREMIHVWNYKKEEKLNIGQMDRQTDRWTDGQTNSTDRKTIKVIYM